MNDAPVLTTERLELWKPQASDIEAILTIVSDPRTGRYLGSGISRADHFARFYRNAGSWLLNGYGAFIFRLRGQERPIGNGGIFQTNRGLGEDFDDKPEAGWILAADQVGKGLAHEAMTAALAWFDEEHGPREVVCMISPGNEPSIALAGKLGFLPTRLATLPDGEDVRLFSRASGSARGRS